MDRDLGFVPSEETSPEARTAYLYISNKRVVGFASAEIIQACLHFAQLVGTIDRTAKGNGGCPSVVGPCQVSESRNRYSSCEYIREKLIFGIDCAQKISRLLQPNRSWSSFCSKLQWWSVDGNNDILVYDCS